MSTNADHYGTGNEVCSWHFGVLGGKEIVNNESEKPSN